MTALHIASAAGYKDIVEVLLEFGANPRATDEVSWNELVHTLT